MTSIKLNKVLLKEPVADPQTLRISTDPQSDHSVEVKANEKTVMLDYLITIKNPISVSF